MKWLLLTVLLWSWNQSPQVDVGENGVLTIVVQNVKKGKGSFKIAIYNTSESFLSDHTFKGIVEPVTGTGEVKVVVDDLPMGKYAISMYHDENDNGELDAGLFKIPKEPYGFSNDARGMFGPPSYDESEFEMSEKNQTIYIKIK